jgi:TonB family protein
MPPNLTHVWLAAGVLLAAAPLRAQAPGSPVRVPATASTGATVAANTTRDSAHAALRQRFAADVLAAATADGAPAAGLVVLAADPATGHTELKLAHATIAEAALTPAVEHVRAGLRPLAAGGPLLWHVRLDPKAAAPGRMTPPVIANPREVRAQINQFVTRHFTDIFQGRRGIRVELELVVAREGDVAYVRLARSCGNPVVDAEALRIAPTMRFTPARMGDQPVDTRITFPFYFVLGEA